MLGESKGKGMEWKIKRVVSSAISEGKTVSKRE